MHGFSGFVVPGRNRSGGFFGPPAPTGSGLNSIFRRRNALRPRRIYPIRSRLPRGFSDFAARGINARPEGRPQTIVESLDRSIMSHKVVECILNRKGEPTCWKESNWPGGQFEPHRRADIFLHLMRHYLQRRYGAGADLVCEVHARDY